MIEIFALYKLCQHLGKKLRGKGYGPLGLQILLVVLWFVGEFLGGFVGGIIQFITSGSGEGISPLVYLIALLGAVAGATTVFLIAHFLKPRPTQEFRTHAFPVESVRPQPIESQTGPQEPMGPQGS